MAELMMIATMWDSIASWFTPTVLFCVANLIIATIFIASNKHHHHLHGDSNLLTRIGRVSSFLERTRSMSFSSYTVEESHHQFPTQPKTASYSSTSRLAQSIHMSSSYVELPESEGFRPPSLFERVRSFKFSSDCNENEFPVESDQISDSPGELARAPSFLDRVKSFKLASVFKPVNVNPDPGHNPEHNVIRSKSEKPQVKKSLVEMKKSLSEVRMAADDDDDVDVRRPATARESRNEADEQVDAKADDFISRFKQQLKLQRVESLVRYNEMLKRRSY